MNFNELTREISKRDMRYYGLQGFDLQDSLVLGQIAASASEEQAQREVDFITLTFPLLDSRTQAEVLAKVKRCPLRKQAV